MSENVDPIERIRLELLDKYSWGAREGILGVLRVIKEHEAEKSTYTVKELEEFLTAVAEGVCPTNP